METAKRFNRNFLFFLHILLAFLLVFEGQWELPTWLQVGGRMHPLLLHLPIGFLLLLGLSPLLRKELEESTMDKVQTYLLHLTSLGAVLTALAGLWLAQEEGYNSVAVVQHKWMGAILSGVVYGLLIWKEKKPKPNSLFMGATLAAIVGLMITSHRGAGLTHGEDFLLGPVQQEEASAMTDSSRVFQTAIMPILDQKCVSCHNEQKAKGALVMSTLAGLMEGGESGPIWVAGDPSQSSLYKRLILPLHDEEHMPPEGKSQPSKREIDLIRAWIEAAASVDLQLGKLDPKSELYTLLHEGAKEEANSYAFPPADPQLLEELNNPFRTVKPLSIGSPALQADIFVREYFEINFLEELTQIKDQLVSLNLSRMPIRDQDLSTISQFSQLERLILNETDIQGDQLQELKKCTKLRSLSLSSTAIEAEHLYLLEGLTQLEEVYVWNTKVDSADLASLESFFPELHLILGFEPSKDELLTLSKPILQTKEPILQPGEGAILDNKLPGAEIRYTLDGTEPDSLKSMLYDSPIYINSPTEVKAKTFREGWISSETESYLLFPVGIPIDSSWFASPPHPKYPGMGAEGLIDGVKGRFDPKLGGRWVGFREQPMELYIDLGPGADLVQTIAMSYLERFHQWIVWPEEMEIWGGNDLRQLELLETVSFESPKENRPQRIAMKEVQLAEAYPYRYWLICAQPVRKLPRWHKGKGKAGWLMVDEVFLYGPLDQ